MITANQWYNIAKTANAGSKTGIRVELGGYYALLVVEVDFGSVVITAVESNINTNEVKVGARIRYNNGAWFADVRISKAQDSSLTASLYNNSGWSTVAISTSTPGTTVCLINDIMSQITTGTGESLFEIINVGTPEEPQYAVAPKAYNGQQPGIVSKTFITFGGFGNQDPEETAKYTLERLNDVLLTTPPAGGDVLTYDETKKLWVNQPAQAGLDEQALALYLYQNNYAKHGDVKEAINTALNYLGLALKSYTQEEETRYYLESTYDFVTLGAISFGGFGQSSGGGGGGGLTSFDIVFNGKTYSSVGSTVTIDGKYATEDWVTQQGFITSIPDNYVTITGNHNIKGINTFEKGLIVGNTAITEKEKENTKYVEIDGNLVVTGSISFGGFGQSSGSGEGGLTQVTVKLGEKEYVSDGGVVTLPAYPIIPSNISSFANDAEYATLTQVDTKIAELVNAAPETLDTLGEIASQIQANIGVLDVLTQSITVNAGNISTLQGYFTDGAANNALMLGGQNIEYFATAAGLTATNVSLENHISAYNTFKSNTEDRLSALESLWTLDEEHEAVRTTLNLIVEKAISFGGFGQSTGGVTTLEALLDVELTNPSNGQSLVYEDGKWINKAISVSGGLDVTAMWGALATVDATKVIDSSHIPDLSGKYLSLNGGTISNYNYGALDINRITDVGYSAIKYSNSGGILGYIGVGGSGSDFPFQPTFYDGTNSYGIIHSGNIGSQSVANAQNLKYSDGTLCASVNSSGQLLMSQAIVLTDSRSVAVQLNDGSITSALHLQGGTILSLGKGTSSKGCTLGIYGDTYFYNQSGNSNVIIKENGNVLIGTKENNGYKLDVAGTLNATTIYQNGQTLDKYYLPLSGGAMVGPITLPGYRFLESGLAGIDAYNSDIIQLNAIYTADSAQSASEAIHFARNNGNWDTLGSYEGVLYYYPDRGITAESWSNAYKIIHSGNYNLYALPLSNSGEVYITNTTGGVVNFKSTSNVEVGIRLFFGTTNKGGLWWNDERGFYMYNATADARLGINNNGTPFIGIGTNTYTIYHTGNLTPSNYLPKSGGTLTGPLTLATNQYGSNTFGIDAANSDIIGVNAIFTSDSAESAGEGIQFATGTGTYDSIWANSGVLYFSPNGNLNRAGTYSTNYTVLHSGNYSSYALPLSGGAMRGNISYKGSMATSEIIRFLNNTDDGNGNGIAIGGGGRTIIGGGESAALFETYTGLSGAASAGAELMVVSNDSDIYFFSNCQNGISAAHQFKMSVNGVFSLTGIKMGQNYDSDNRAKLEVITTGDYPCDIFLGTNNQRYWSLTARNTNDSFPYGFGIYNSLLPGYALVIRNDNKVVIGDNPNVYVGSNWLSIVNSTPNTNTLLFCHRTDTNYKISFGVGSGGINRGVYDDNYGRWLLYASNDGYTYLAYNLRINQEQWANGLIINRTVANSGASILVQTQGVNIGTFGINGSKTFEFAVYNGSTSTTKMTCDSNGNLVAQGAITFGSDERYKTKLSDASVTLEDIANAPLFNYRWNDREDSKVHLGTTAQYWNNTTFRNAVCPTNDEKLWTMSYSEIAMGNTIVIARELIPIKRKVSEIDKIKQQLQQTQSELQLAQGEIKSLKQQLNTYRRAS